MSINAEQNNGNEGQKVIWIIGDPKDAAMKTLHEEALAVGHEVIFEEDIGKTYYLTPPDMVIYGYMSAKEPVQYGVAQLLELSEIKPHCPIFLNALGDLPLELAGEVDISRQIMGFSPMSLYVDRYVLEISRTLKTSPDVFQNGKAFLEGIGMKVFEVPDTPGMVLPRIVAMLVNEAASALMEGVAGVEEIDQAMKLGTGYPEGPLAWGDKIGLDIIHEILLYLHREYGDDRYRPMLRLKQMVLAGQLGVKTGQGFFTYDAPVESSISPIAPSHV